MNRFKLPIRTYDLAVRLGRELSTHVHRGFLTVWQLQKMNTLENGGWKFLLNEGTRNVTVISPRRDVIEIGNDKGGIKISKENFR